MCRMSVLYTVCLLLLDSVFRYSFVVAYVRSLVLLQQCHVLAIALCLQCSYAVGRARGCNHSCEVVMSICREVVSPSWKSIIFFI